MYMFFQTRSTLFHINENIKEDSNRLDIMQSKHDYLLSLQINYFLENKNTKYDFINVGEREQFRIL